VKVRYALQLKDLNVFINKFQLTVLSCTTSLNKEWLLCLFPRHKFFMWLSTPFFSLAHKLQMGRRQAGTLSSIKPSAHCYKHNIHSNKRWYGSGVTSICKFLYWFPSLRQSCKNFFPQDSVGDRGGTTECFCSVYLGPRYWLTVCHIFVHVC
jgi:hypothetical protein